MTNCRRTEWIGWVFCTTNRKSLFINFVQSTEAMWTWYWYITKVLSVVSEEWVYCLSKAWIYKHWILIFINYETWNIGFLFFKDWLCLRFSTHTMIIIIWSWLLSNAFEDFLLSEGFYLWSTWKRRKQSYSSCN